MKKSLYLFFISASLLAFDANAWWGSKKDTNKEKDIQQSQTQEFVDAKMHETLSSIDRKLHTLVLITRGGEPARKPGPIGYTALGADGTQRKPEYPPPIPTDDSFLDRTVKIQWNGSAESLLNNISNQIGYRFSNNNEPFAYHIRLEAEDISLKDALEMIARKIDGQADILVSTKEKTVTLVQR